MYPSGKIQLPRLFIIFNSLKALPSRISEPNNDSLLAPCWNTIFPFSTYIKSTINDRKLPSLIRKGQSAADGHTGTTNTARH